MTSHLIAPPSVTVRGEQPYVGVARDVTMDTLPEVSEHWPRIVDGLSRLGIEPAGPSFVRYRVIDMANLLRVEAGVPVAAAPEAAPEGTFAGVLPGGRYLTAAIDGGPSVDAVREFLEWAQTHGMEWDCEPTPEGDRWGCRLESFPQDAERPRKRRTELAFRLADQA